MSLPRSLFLHTSLLVVGAAAATWAYTREKTPEVTKESEATVISGRPADVQRVVYEAKNKKVVVEPAKGAAGDAYYAVTVEHSAPSLIAGADAGAARLPATTSAFFVSNDPGKKLFDALVPLRASRSIGKVASPKDKDYGLDRKETSFTVTVSGLERKLFVGDTAPGGTDSYVVDANSSQAYVVRGDFVKDLESADTKLAERELHAWKEADARSAKIMAGGKTRELVRGGPDNHRFWADPGDRDKQDETVANWLQKVDRLRPGDFFRTAPAGTTTVARIEFAGEKGNQLGFFELVKAPDPAQAGKSLYFAITERTHVHAKVSPQLAEQVEQDLASVVK